MTDISILIILSSVMLSIQFLLKVLTLKFN